MKKQTEYQEWKEAKKEVNAIIREMLKTVHKKNIEYLTNALFRGTLIEDYMKTKMESPYGVPKDFIVALAQKMEWNYRNNFGTRIGKRTSNRRVGKYVRDMGI